MSFKVGDKVSWKSQAGGFWKEKQGVVVEVVPPGKRPGHAVKEPGFGRLHESYVIQLDLGPRKTQAETDRKPKFFWPVVSKLVKIT